MEELTERQKDILRFIQEEIKEKGYPPSVREIGKAVGLKSPASVHSHLKSLEKFNYIRRDPSKPRAIEVLYGDEDKINKEMLHIPIVGQVTAGQPILAQENIEDYFPVPTDYVRTSDKELFMLKIKGNSMINAGIYDGDYVIAQKQDNAENGDIIIALIDNEATVKRYYKERDHIRLQPENPDMDPIYVNFNTYFKVLGKIIGLYRQF
ncbi:transcriptional repressor LexA [Halothermothrix orenii]|uniref:LexA repressor n=1 Tax=Halothermothrix orenii (strain H 168 / OCM 544 / DSM 9562) TaxID=373903 RepID=B8CX80_HALOH|nr:transcriptional repressor LexA [Halothermothrix orenii]ACL69899.1 SOS-response transcriptional repressor, LexA [Halothermothrix orenii H 168]